MALIDPYVLAVQLKNCLCNRLATSALGAVCRCSVYPSDVPTADICQKDLAGNGEAKVMITRIYDSVNFPFPVSAERKRSCASYTVVEIVQTVWRCAPTLGNNGELPAVFEEETAAVGLFDDALAMRCAVKCCVDSTLIEVGDWRQLTMQGGCMGGQLTSLIGIDAMSCIQGSI